LFGDRHDGPLARPVGGRLRVDLEDDLDARLAGERRVYVGQVAHGMPVDGEYVVPLGHVDADLGERRARGVLPVVAPEDAVDPVRPAPGVARQPGPQQAHRRARRLRGVAPADVRVAVVDLAYQLAEQVGEVVAGLRVRDEL